MAERDLERGMRTALLGMAVNSALAMVKIVTGVVGHSYAMIADGIESLTDSLTSAIVWGGLKVSGNPPDEEHPYGHGKAESLAAAVVAVALIAAALLIAVQSVREILTPHTAPRAFVLLVLGVVIIGKEILFRRVIRVSRALQSTALRSDAWHHRSDAITSAAVFVGISVALIGGEGYESADDWAALLACAIIGYNGFTLLRVALHEIMDGAVSEEQQEDIRSLAAEVEGVTSIDKCRVRKSGTELFMDIHVRVDGRMSVHASHALAHRVKDTLLESGMGIVDVVVHIEPEGGRSPRRDPGRAT